MNIEEFFRLAAGEIPGPIIVGRVSRNVQTALGVDTRAVLLSRNTVEKQMRRHGKLTLSGYYDYLPHALEHGEAFRLHDRRVAIILDVRHSRDHRLSVVIKSTKDRDGLYAISLYPLREKDWARTLRKHNPIP